MALAGKVGWRAQELAGEATAGAPLGNWVSHQLRAPHVGQDGKESLNSAPGAPLITGLPCGRL